PPALNSEKVRGRSTVDMATRLPKVPMRTNLGFVFSMLERSITDSLSVRRFGQNEIAQVMEFFGAEHPECVFCGDTAVDRWDHLVPVSLGGRDGSRQHGVGLPEMR